MHVIPTALGRGAQVFARELVDELGGAKNGHRLVALFDGPADIRVDRTLGLPGGAGAATGLHPLAVASLARTLHHLRPRVVVAHGGDAFKYLALATRAPIAYCAIGTWPGAVTRNPRHVLWRALIHRAWIVAAVSDDVAADCRETLRLSDNRLIVIPNGRDAERFRPATRRSRADAGREAQGTPEPQDPAGVTLLFAGHLDSGKRPDRFVELVRTLREDGLPVTGKIVGDGPLGAALRGRAAAAGVELLGWRDDVVPHLQGADILIFPSAPDGEGMPGVLIEAGLCGLPAVATRVAGASAVIEHGQTGLIVPVEDFAALVRATAELAREPARRTAMGAAARAKCEATFALPVVARSWDRLLRVGLELSSGGARSMPTTALEPLRTPGRP